MPRADQRLYAALLRLGRQFQKERLPLLGVAGTELVCHNLAWRPCLRAALEVPRPGAGLAEGAQLLRMLQLQLETLMQAEEHTREALAEWATLVDRFSSNQTSRSSSSSSSSGSGGSFVSHSSSGGSMPGMPAPPGLPFAAAAAAEAGLALLSRQAQELTDPLLFSEMEMEMEMDEEEGEQGQQGRSQEPPALTLDELAMAVRRQHPGIFPSGDSSPESPASSTSNTSNTSNTSSMPTGSTSGGGGGAGAGTRLAQAAALADVLYRQQRFKFEPFEWVYEGLSPLLLPQRLCRRKLSPLTLAVLTAGVGRRLGLPLLPLPAEPAEGISAGVTEGPAGGAAAQGLPMEQLRPDVAQRYAGKAAAAAPSAGPWVLLLDSRDSSSGSGSGGGQAVEVHGASSAEGAAGAAPGQQGRQPQWTHVMDACTGEVLDVGQARLKFPYLQLGADWQLRVPLTAWQHMVRTIIQAHQRRGESDLVAHWVYVLLALEPQAPEWAHMLPSSPSLHTG